MAIVRTSVFAVICASVSLFVSVSISSPSPWVVPMGQVEHQENQKTVDRRQAMAQPADQADSTCAKDDYSTKLGTVFDKNMFSYVFSNDTSKNITVLWTGDDDSIMMVVSTNTNFNLSTLYISKHFGMEFEDHTKALGNFAISSVQQNPVDRKWVYLVGYSNSTAYTTLFVTSNGLQFEKVDLHFKLNGTLRFHPSDPKMLLALSGELQQWRGWLSVDGGKNWEEVHNYVHDIQWGFNASKTFYFTQGQQISFEDVNKKQYDLVKATDLGKELNVVAHRVRTFEITGKFLFALVYADEACLKSILRVSTNGGLRWNEVQLPVKVEDQFYKVLDMSDGMVFIHVDEPNDRGYGTLFTSDSDGIVFSESLRYHAHAKEGIENDFYKVKSIRGVYVTSEVPNGKIMNGTNNKINTVITFNRGANWNSLRTPVRTQCQDQDKSKCLLQILSQVDSATRHIMGPLSTKSAVGIILAHGFLGEFIPNSPDVFVSSDGGYNWAKALTGPHLYAIADHGGLLVAVSQTSDQATDTVRFSLDEGQTWYCYIFTKAKMKVTGLLTDPESWSLKVGIWGYGINDTTWKVVVIDFEPIIGRQCKEPDDFTNFYAHNEMTTDDGSQQGCLLGAKETYRRVEKGSKCYLGQTHIVNRMTEYCKCTKDDYECDYGFRRWGTECAENPKFKGAELDICRDGEEKKIITYGYRKIPGDICKDGYDPGERYEKSVKIKCREGDKVYFGSLHVGPTGSAMGLVILIVLIVIMTGLIFGMSIFFIRKFNQINNSPITYRYLRLNQDDVQDETVCIVTNNLENATTESSEDEPATLFVDTCTSNAVGTMNKDSNTKSMSQSKKYYVESDEELLQ